MGGAGQAGLLLPRGLPGGARLLPQVGPSVRPSGIDITLHCSTEILFTSHSPLSALANPETHLQYFVFLGRLLGFALRDRLLVPLPLPAVFFKARVSGGGGDTPFHTPTRTRPDYKNHSTYTQTQLLSCPAVASSGAALLGGVDLGLEDLRELDPEMHRYDLICVVGRCLPPHHQPHTHKRPPDTNTNT